MPCVEYPVECLSGEEASRKIMAEKRRLQKMKELEEKKRIEAERQIERMKLKGQMPHQDNEGEEEDQSGTGESKLNEIPPKRTIFVIIFRSFKLFR